MSTTRKPRTVETTNREQSALVAVIDEILTARYLRLDWEKFDELIAMTAADGSTQFPQARAVLARAALITVADPDTPPF